jgi:hypothetical protein
LLAITIYWVSEELVVQRIVNVDTEFPRIATCGMRGQWTVLDLLSTGFGTRYSA